MKSTTYALGALLAVILLGVGAVPVRAHHSFSAEFSEATPAEITGTLTKLEWVNPHVQLYVDVKGENGEVEKWKLESGPTIHFHAAHLKAEMFPAGQVLKMRVYMAKDGTKNFAFMRAVTFVGGPFDGKSYEF
jgi:hypothetical protein